MEQTTKSTAAACTRDVCDGCDIEGKLLCIHTQRDLIDFAVLFIGWAIPFIAGMIIGRFWIGLAVWVGLAVLFFGYVEAYILCRHCPHYAEEGSTLSCHANWGLPKIPRFDPHPASKVEKVAWLLYAALLFLYYIPFFIISGQWVLFIVTTWASIIWAWTVQRTKCTRCYNLSCPVNRVPDNIREKFFEHYPAFAEAWGKNTVSSSGS